MTEARPENLRAVCAHFRRAIIASMPLSSPCMRHFPYGACGDTSLLLGAYLDSIGFGVFHYVLGTRYVWNAEYHIYEDSSHAWLEKDGIAVDLTATQYPFFGDHVHISPTKKYRMAFDIQSSFPYWTFFDGNALNGEKKTIQSDRLREDYQTIIKTMNVEL